MEMLLCDSLHWAVRFRAGRLIERLPQDKEPRAGKPTTSKHSQCVFDL